MVAVLKVTDCSFEEVERWAELAGYRMTAEGWLASAVEEHTDL